MKASAFLVALLAVVFPCSADYSLEDISPHFSTHMPIIWKAPTNHLPKSFWIYRKFPRMFSETTISNAIILASFQDKGFPKPSTNRVILWADSTEGEPQPPSFAILPDEGQLDYSLGDRAPDSTGKVANDEAAVQRAWDRLLQLGIDRREFVKTNAATPGTWGVFLPRQIDRIQTYYESEGFLFQQFGNHGKIRCFSLTLPNLERQTNSPTATPKQIIACLRAFKTPMAPGNKPDYFLRVKALAKAKTLTITMITPYYSEGVYGETPTNNEPPNIVAPLAELEAVADFGDSNVTVRLLSPILSSEVTRLLNE